MGNCCCGDSGADKGYSNFNGGGATGGTRSGGGGPETERDREARVLAAERAAARQQQFETSAVGKAAYKSVQEVKDSRKAGGGNTGQPTAADWQN
ncbi:hypothetical protein CHLRE_02g092650v5 [Chlamydomonas reinhardtii]|uniref:Uncharacterized protein n=1 Tax=Chlamydomonas reinhardtii TaxID=3055 RepID=A8I9E5_CHLRE|nr:uncharacterized protein CHLRE_02g092650v5 [Chlamydomonas reinhardtii]PNW86584.1 hypothetical protein CHLRE_02g092650v5 [Chlamydomonas reinhardtii]|eukprot:XP_001701986.1 hypothetical protein CHLREDRAFT_141551 [Chlamydomonas reinhardtii]